jgi:hypothetical protein
MKIETEIVITLNEIEAITLKKFTGSFSMKHQKDMGLSDDESKIISEIYSALPHLESNDPL